MKIKLFKSGASVVFDKTGAWYSVLLRLPSGNVGDKIRCDDYRMALEYKRAFEKIARNAQ